MEVFARVVELGGFSAAARAFRMSPSAVSKLIARLESRLGVRLINRSTRKLQLTPEGTAYYDRSIRILDDINTAEHEAAIGATPRGRVRVNTSVPFGLHWLLPLLPGFLKLHPGVSVDVSLTDTVVDLLEERADIAIRVGPLRESRLLARKLGESRMVVIAAPRLSGGTRNAAHARRSRQTQHARLLLFKQIDGWPFRDKKGGTITVAPVGNALVSDGEAMQRLAASGAGLARPRPLPRRCGYQGRTSWCRCLKTSIPAILNRSTPCSSATADSCPRECGRFWIIWLRM